MARNMFPGERAVGKYIRQGFPQSNNPAAQIIGVVADVQRFDLDHAPFDEADLASMQQANGGENFVIRTQGDPASYARAMEDAVHSLDKDLPLNGLRPINAVL